MKTAALWPPLWRSRLAALIAFAALLGGCAQGATPDSEPEAALTSPGRAEDFSWYWDEVSAVQDKADTYVMGVRFTNLSDDAARVPDCWAIPGPGRAAALTWDKLPVLEASETMWLEGIVTFARPIWEIDDVACDPEVAASYRR